MDKQNKEKVFKILKEIEILKNLPKKKLYISEKELRKHLSENEILELLNKGILEDRVLK